MKKKNEIIKNLDGIYKDIMKIKIEPEDSFITSMNKFYEVMRKWGICQGTWLERGGRSCCTPEWNMCYMVFKENKMMQFDMWMTLTDPPEDLMAYGKKPDFKTF